MNTLIPQQKLSDFLKHKQDLISLTNQSHECFEKFNRTARLLNPRSYTHSADYGILFRQSPYLRSKADVLKEINKCLWSAFIDLSGVQKYMTKAAISDLRKKLDAETPDFTQEAVEEILANSQEFYLKNINNTIQEVYHKLIGCRYKGGGYYSKRDNLRRVEKQFRISHAGITEGFSNRYRYDDYNAGFNFEDLYTVCKILDEKPTNDYSDTFRALADKQLEGKASEVKTAYFDVVCYKNGNRKVTWKRLDILSLFNKYATNGSFNLPDNMRKRYKPEHFTQADINFGTVNGSEDFFETPPELIDRMIVLAQIQDDSIILDPEAGEGAILKRLQNVSHKKAYWFEINEERANKIFSGYFYNADYLGADFLAYNSKYIKFDRIIMNPPFNNQQDIIHVAHALDLLADDGVLVSVMSSGVKFRTNERTTAFLTYLSTFDLYEFIDLPEGSFKESGTNVNSVLLVVHK